MCVLDSRIFLPLIAALILPGFSLAQIDLQTHGTATQSSDWNTAGTFAAPKGIDDDTSTFTHTKNWSGSWWQLELDQAFTLERIEIVNRNGWAERMEGLNLRVYDGSDQLVHEAVLTNPGISGTHGENLPEGTEVKRVWIGLDPGEQNGNDDFIVTVAEVILFDEYTPIPTDPLPPQAISEPVSVTQFDDAIAVYFHGFDVARTEYPALELKYRLVAAGGAISDEESIDLTGDWEKPAILIRKDNAEYLGIAVSAENGENVFFRRYYPLNGTTSSSTLIPTLAQNAAIELGQFVNQSPTIPLPDRSQFGDLTVGIPERRFNIDAHTLQVTSDINYPLVSSSQLCALSRQTDFPNDAAKRSLYIPLKSQLYNQTTGDPESVAHYLCEVPLDPNWLSGTEDLELTLNPSQIKVHFTDELHDDGRPITGDGGGGLGQGSGTMDVDADGNIYFSNNVPVDVVRFNISTATWEAPPVNLDTLSDGFLPTDDDILGNGGTEKNGRWQFNRIVAQMNHSSPSRMLYARPISILSGNGTVYEWGALFTLPTDWSDPVSFANDFNLLVGTWPSADYSFYDTLPETNGALRRIQWYKSYGDSIYAQPYPEAIGGPWRIDVAPDNTVAAFGTPSTMPDYEDGKTKPVDTLPHNANHRIAFEDYGLLTMERSDLSYCLTGTTNNSLTGQVEVSYDAVAHMLENADDFQLLINNMGGPSLSPSYIATHAPGQAGKLIGAGEYGYQLSEFDTNQTTPGEVEKTFLTLDSPDPNLSLPMAAGLGPHSYQWSQIGNDDWLYLAGYIGLSRFKYAEDGTPLGRYSIQQFDADLSTVILDAGGAGQIKRYQYLQPGLDDRMFLTGRHTAARGGTAYSNGLMSFHRTDLDTLWKLSYMSRCYNTQQLRNRIIRDIDGLPVQEFFARAFYIPEYEHTIEPQHVPAISDPKVFKWDYKSGGQMRDLLGFSLASLEGAFDVKDIAFSNDRRYIIILQGDQLMTHDVQENRFVDGKTIDYGSDLQTVTYEWPIYSFTRAPDDRLFLYVRPTDDSVTAAFLEIQVSAEGALSIVNHLEVLASSPTVLEDSFNVQHTYLPDYANGDGSYDLFLGQERAKNGGGTVCRIIEDFVPARYHELSRSLNLLSSGVDGASISGTKPGNTPYRATCANAENISLAAAAPAGYVFDEWQDEDGDSMGSLPLNLNMTEDRTITAIYSPAPVGPPPAPTGVHATDGTLAQEVRITWNAADGAQSYEVWRNSVNDSSSAVRVASGISGTTYSDTSVGAQGVYFYWLRTVGNMATSAFSVSDQGRPRQRRTFPQFVSDYNLSGPNAASDADPDLDGSTNFEEYLLGGTNPAAGASKPAIVHQIQEESGASYFTISFLRLAGGTESGNTYNVAALSATYEIQGGLGLDAWDQTPVAITPPAGLPAAPIDYEWGCFRLPYELSSEDKGFLRVVIVLPRS